MVKKYLLLPVLILGAFHLNAQDFHLSQYDAAAQYHNPALTGKFNGNYRLHAHYRSQWGAIATRPFTTFALSFDKPVKKWGFGGMIFNQNAGAGYYNVLAAYFTASYTFTLDKEGKHFISPGLMAGGFQKSIDMGKLYFQSQYVPINGGTFDQAVSSGENVASSAFMNYDLGAGLLYFFGKNDAFLLPFIGVTTYHITEPKETFFSTSNKLPMRHIIHGGVKANITDRLQILPKFLNMYQKNNSELTTSLIFQYYFKNADLYLLAGPTYRNKDAAIMEIGAKYGPYTLRLSYDFNTSSLQPYTNSRGGFEVSLTYIPRKFNPNPVINCPKL